MGFDVEGLSELYRVQTTEAEYSGMPKWFGELVPLIEGANVEFWRKEAA